MTRFEGRTALVTGGANGIGRASAIKFAEQGARVGILDIEEGPLAETADAIRAAGGTVLPVVTDMRDRAAVKAAIEKVEAELGPIDLLLNNVGQTARKNASEFLDSVPETWDFVIDLNLMVTFYVSWTVAKGMKDRGFGRIVNISSDSTLIGERSIVDYVAAKSGVSGFTRGLARELAPFGINVNAVAPGVTNTRGPKQLPKDVYDAALAEIPIGHLAEPEDIANAITFLASQEARCITGQMLTVNGGRIFY
ncbi:MAG TPA: SDR family oxidoreductase [Paracoccus sp. (in: a-proteobacteria)]|uniref:SDR family NAD(P)-dependent oxidoreductase n=1 Tax=Paracoccus sp. TaxID=267 RepID=UPI002CB1508F|nr:SDR family oxidoreductase [Paracoccus sp. (in: a-proteobacteria)]HWL57434.1 SDR family oxidoreductase [Paracoccus sp. (in: a-proteobacteria)]